jgi:uridine kinase
VVDRLLKALGDEVATVLHSDAYYRDLSHLTPQERESVNYDHPDAIEASLLLDHLGELAAGRAVHMPAYDFAQHVRHADPLPLEWRPVVIVDGMFVLVDPRLREVLDLKVFVDTPGPVRLERRLRRDVVERGRSTDSVLAQYGDTVLPMHEQFIEPSKIFADIIVADGGDNLAAIELILERLRTLVAHAWEGRRTER